MCPVFECISQKQKYSSELRESLLRRDFIALFVHLFHIFRKNRGRIGPDRFRNEQKLIF